MGGRGAVGVQAGGQRDLGWGIRVGVSGLGLGLGLDLRNGS